MNILKLTVLSSMLIGALSVNAAPLINDVEYDPDNPCLKITRDAIEAKETAAVRNETIAESVMGEFNLKALRTCSQTINELTPPSVSGFLSNLGLGGKIMKNLFSSSICNMDTVKTASRTASRAYDIGSKATSTYDVFKTGDYTRAARKSAGVLGTIGNGKISGQQVRYAKQGATIAGDLYDYQTSGDFNGSAENDYNYRSGQ
jgi:hypothetical protein